jgi:tetratricopeptide (TPR) repeat protein
MTPAATPTDALVDAVNQFKADAAKLPSARRLGPADADALYTMGCNAMRLGQYQDAARCFGFLVYSHPANPVYIKGQALCLKKLGQLDNAIPLFSLLALLEPERPEHLLAVAECQILLHDHAKAREGLALVIQHCSQHPGHDKLLARARGLLDLVRPKEAAHGV